MSSGAAQLRFVADFTVFVIAGAAVTLLLLRPSLLVVPERLRSIVAVGFALLAGAAVASGAGFGPDLDHPALVGLRGVGIVAAAVAPLRWPGGAADRLAMWTGVSGLAVAEALVVADAPVAADWARVAAAAAIGLGLFVAARRSIPVRIAISASAILLAVVLSVAIALSTVLADTVENEATNRLVVESGTEASIAAEAGRTALRSASPAAAALGGSIPEVVAGLADPAAPDAAARRVAVEGALDQLVEQLIGVFDPAHGPVLLVSAGDGEPSVLASVGAREEDGGGDAALDALASSRVVGDAVAADAERQSVVVIGEEAFGVAAAPVQVPAGTGEQTAAVLVVTSRLDQGYLTARQTLSGLGRERGLALLSAGGVVAADGAVGPAGPLVALAERAIERDGRAVRTTVDLLLAAEPVRGADGTAVLAVVATVPTDTLQSTRSRLYEQLFVVSIATTLAALVLAALVGERIGSGLRRLTAAADSITGGDLTVTPDARGDDEVGVLAGAFSSMTASLRAMTSDLRDAADEEARLRSRLEGVVAGMGDALVAVDERGDVTDFNAAAEALTGLDARSAIGRPAGLVLDLIADDGERLGLRMGRPSLEGWSAPATVGHVRGGRTPVVISAGAMAGAGGELAGVVYVLRDVRKEREVDRVKGELLANISHELRTPLSPIRGYSQILRSRDLPPEEVRRFAGEIEEASTRLERVVGQLVDFAAVSAAGIDLQRTSVPVAELVESTVQRWQPRVEAGRHVVASRIDGALPSVWIDRAAMERALDELVDNAVKYSPEGGPVLLNASRGTADGRDVVRIAVVDRGVGIPSERVDDALDEFTQVDGSATRAVGGLGLGLALAARIVRAHGGNLEVSATTGAGTAVTVVLPSGGNGGRGE
jgi:PAS domain S-box-containing protein